MKISALTAAVAILFSMFCSSAAAAAENSDEPVQEGELPRIDVHPSAEVNARKIFLKDLADIRAPDFLRQKIETLDMGFSPKFGEVKSLDRNRIRSRIRSHRAMPEKFVLVVPEKVYVKRASQEIPTQRFRSIYMDYLRERVKGREFRVRDFDVRNAGLYKKGKVSLFLVSNNTRDITGRLTLYVNVSIDGEKQDRVSVSGMVDLFDQVVFASKSLKRGRVISASDVYVERANIANLHGRYLFCREDVLGMALRRSVRQGRHLTRRMVEEPPLVHRGEMVTLAASTGNLSIVTSGIARRDGRLNEQVPVKNVQSGRIVHCVVTGESKVEGL
ncbi:MAG TPA: flagellar basal body P-ring formation chaperone FlgA [Desulfobacteraceae bacterium]|nr:flagellar basal body P-ring formation chaperone FlgA [Desulfobacteraceae bacterium]